MSGVLKTWVIFFACSIFFSVAQGADFQVKIKRGSTADVARYVNVKGTLNILIRTRDGKNELPAVWWIKWSVGTVSQLGKQKDRFITKIPVDWWKGIVSAKLRATASSDTILYISENSALDGHLKFKW